MKKIILAITAALVLNMGAGAAFAADVTVPYATYNPEITSTDVDNNVSNANNTGDGVTVNDGSTVNSVIKSEGMTMNNGAVSQTQRTHGEYQNNTNSCASCHQTHTAASKNLLFKSGVYNTCTACHDGTLGFYNVFGSSTAGTFAGTSAGNMSVHLANDSVAIKAAPGGNKNGTGTWAGTFNCASCHAPHGSYSSRLLHYSPNDMGNTAPNVGGNKAAFVPVFAKSDAAGIAAQAAVMDTVNTTKPQYKFIVVKGNKTEHGITDANVGATDTMLVVYEWKKGTPNSYVKTSNPWLYGYSYGSPKNYWSRFYTTPTVDTTKDASNNYINIIDNNDADVKIDFGKGYAYGINAAGSALLDSAQKADVARAYKVTLDLVPTGQTYGSVKIYTVNESALFKGTLNPAGDYSVNNGGATTVSGWGIAMSSYCAACHTDYMAKSGSASGTFDTSSYRHTTDSDSYTCLRCHFAHGTDVTVMKDAHGDTVTDLQTKINPATGVNWTDAEAKAYMLDQNPSSALKRYTNMAVCWACHTDSKATQLKNNEAYQNNPDAPHGLTD